MPTKEEQVKRANQLAHKIQTIPNRPNKVGKWRRSKDDKELLKELERKLSKQELKRCSCRTQRGVLVRKDGTAWWPSRRCLNSFEAIYQYGSVIEKDQNFYGLKDEGLTITAEDLERLIDPLADKDENVNVYDLRNKNGYFFKHPNHLGWLNDNIVNAYFFLLRRYHREIYFFPTTYWQQIDEGTAENRKHYMAAAAELDPNKGGWMMPINLNNNHWVLLYKKHRRGHAAQYILYDSLFDPKKPKSGHSSAKIEEKLSKYFPIDKIKYHKRRTHKDRNDDGPVQKNTRDCGVFVCMNAFALANKRPLFSQRHVRAFRRRIGHDIVTGTKSDKFPPPCPNSPAPNRPAVYNTARTITKMMENDAKIRVLYDKIKAKEKEIKKAKTINLLS